MIFVCRLMHKEKIQYLAWQQFNLMQNRPTAMGKLWIEFYFNILFSKFNGMARSEKNDKTPCLVKKTLERRIWQDIFHLKTKRKGADNCGKKSGKWKTNPPPTCWQKAFCQNVKIFVESSSRHRISKPNRKKFFKKPTLRRGDFRCLEEFIKNLLIKNVGPTCARRSHSQLFPSLPRHTRIDWQTKFVEQTDSKCCNTTLRKWQRELHGRDRQVEKKVHPAVESLTKNIPHPLSFAYELKAGVNWFPCKVKNFDDTKLGGPQTHSARNSNLHLKTVAQTRRNIGIDQCFAEEHTLTGVLRKQTSWNGFRCVRISTCSNLWNACFTLQKSSAQNLFSICGQKFTWSQKLQTGNVSLTCRSVHKINRFLIDPFEEEFDRRSIIKTCVHMLYGLSASLASARGKLFLRVWHSIERKNRPLMFEL